MFDAIVVGSGPAGVMAARQLAGKREVLVLDVGHRPAIEAPSEDLPALLIGERFEGLHNLHNESMSLKLKSPGLRYVVKDEAGLSPVRTSGFSPALSFAAGGLANAWGAGVYRFTAADLAGFPVSRAELDPFYDDIGRHIGISGANDDLLTEFGTEPELQAPVRLSRFATSVLEGYQRRRANLAADGITVGRTRLAVLTNPHNGRPAFAYGSHGFFRAGDRSIYNPAFTLDELVSRARIRYEAGYLVRSYVEHEDGVEVIAEELRTRAVHRFDSRALILCAGAIQSAKVVLEANRDTDTRLPLLDNPMACLPLFRLPLAGKARDSSDSSLGLLNLVLERDGEKLQGSIYGASGPLRSDVIFNLPLSANAGLSVLKRLAAASGLLMMFYPCDPERGGTLRMGADGVLELRCEGKREYPGLDILLRAVRAMGCAASGAMWQYPSMGAGIHYAGTLPMRQKPVRYQLDSGGRLFGTKRVYVADGAAFPRLPAKNLTFTIMANAARIASGIPFEAM